jgi:hypothetical protein
VVGVGIAAAAAATALGYWEAIIVLASLAGYVFAFQILYEDLTRTGSGRPERKAARRRVVVVAGAVFALTAVLVIVAAALLLPVLVVVLASLLGSGAVAVVAGASIVRTSPATPRDRAPRFRE